MIRDQEALVQLLARTRAFVQQVAIPNEDRVEEEDLVPEEAVQATRVCGRVG